MKQTQGGVKVLSVLNNAIELFEDGYLDINTIAENVGRKYGVSPLEVISEKERRIEILKNFSIVLDCLSEKQSLILSCIGAGMNTVQIEESTGIDQSNSVKIRKSISQTLDEYVNEDRIQFLAKKIDQLSKTSRGRNSRLLFDLVAEYSDKMAVREALKKLFVLLTPPVSTKEIGSGISLPAFTFERMMNVNVGMREGIEDGRKVMKTITKCHIPEYFKDTKIDNTCCTLCATCKRKKDIVGR